MNVEPSARDRGCFFDGCVIALVLAVVIGGGAFIGLRFVVRRVNRFIAEYTETSPMVLPRVEMPAEELRALKARVGAFVNALDARANTPPLILTGREINVLFADSEAAKDLKLKDRFYISLEGEAIKGEVSLPYEEYTHVPFIKTKGRYLNGSGVFKVGLTNAALFVTIQSLTVKGGPLPDPPLSQLQSQNFAEKLNDDETNQMILGRIENLQVTNGMLVIKAKSR